MEKKQSRVREIKFYSKKNGEMSLVHSERAKAYAAFLERSPDVEKYECCVPLEKSSYIHIETVGIRKSYFSTDWTTDFRVKFADGRIGVFEMAKLSELLKDSIIQKLEFSRRYWSQQGVSFWKILLVEG